MFSKEKSKEFLKFKYVLLIPVLLSMLIYSSCENTETDTALSKSNEKRLIKVITGDTKNKDGTIIKGQILELNKEGYLDQYVNGATPSGREISFSDLSNEEKKEFNEDKYFNSDKESKTFRFFEMEDGRRAVQQVIDWESLKNSWKSKDYSNADVVPFAAIDQVPVFPGCEDAKDQKACLIQKITDHVSANFDIKIGKDLGLTKGKKRVYVQFKIDKTGEITDIKARGPDEKLEAEALRVVSSLPKMIPGKKNGRKVGVKYTLPITFVVD